MQLFSMSQLTPTTSLGSLCSSFALVAPPLRLGTRDAAYPADPAVIATWTSSLSKQQDWSSFDSKCGINEHLSFAQSSTSAASYDAPGGAWLMELMLRSGMYAPMETRIFHHIISVWLLLSAFAWCSLGAALVHSCSEGLCHGALAAHCRRWSERMACDALLCISAASADSFVFFVPALILLNLNSLKGWLLLAPVAVSWLSRGGV